MNKNDNGFFPHHQKLFKYFLSLYISSFKEKGAIFDMEL